MRAAIFREPGRPLEIKRVEIAEPGVGEVMVRLAASGVCHSDYHVLKGDWTDVPVPLVLGHEGAGIVEAIGPGVDNLTPGDHVVLSWSPNCGLCPQCISGRPLLCSLAAATAANSLMFDGTARIRDGDNAIYSYLTVGSFGEYAVVPQTGAIKVDSTVPFDRAAIVGCAITTGFGAATNTVQVPVGASAATIGCGGVGLAVLQGLVAQSAGPIIAIDVNDEKLALAKRLGATDVVNSAHESSVDAVLRITDGRGVDFAFEAVGLKRTLQESIQMLAPAGTAVVVGQPASGVTIEFDPGELSMYEQRIVGSNYGSCVPAVDFPRLLKLYAQGTLDLDSMITRRISLDEVNDAFAAMAHGETVRTVIVYDA